MQQALKNGELYGKISKNNKGGNVMFDNIGGKIKGVAQALTWIGIILSCIAGLFVFLFNSDTPLSGLLIIVLGCLFSWLSSLTLYGLGQLIENTDILVAQGRKAAEKPKYTSATPTTNKHMWRCSYCGNMTSEETCPICSRNQTGTK